MCGSESLSPTQTKAALAAMIGFAESQVYDHPMFKKHGMNFKSGFNPNNLSEKQAPKYRGKKLSRSKRKARK